MLFTFAQIFSWLINYSYLILMPIAIIEGPIITVIAGFLSSLGVLNLLLAYLTVVIGDMIGDALYYSIGYFGREKFIARWGKYIGLKMERVLKMESLFENRGKAILIWGKITQVFGVLVLVSAGIGKYKFKDFMLVNFIITIPKAAILLLVGFYFGQAYVKIKQYLDYTFFITFALGIILAFIYWGVKKYIEKSIKIE